MVGPYGGVKFRAQQPKIASHFRFGFATREIRQAPVFTGIIAKWEAKCELGDRLPSSGRLLPPVSRALNTPSEPFEAYLKGV